MLIISVIKKPHAKALRRKEEGKLGTADPGAPGQIDADFVS